MSKKVIILVTLLACIFIPLVSSANYYNYVYNGTTWIPMLSDADGQQKFWIEMKNCSYGNVQENLVVGGNITLGQKITFALGEVIDNIVDGFIRITGGLNIMSSSGDSKFFVNATSGNVGIGTTTPGHLITLSGGAYCDGTGDWITGSDIAYKKDIDYDFKYGLKEIEQLKPVTYIHKEDEENRTQIGFIAQDMIKVIPELVGGEEGSYGIAYSQLTAVLVNAVQELRAQSSELRGEIWELKLQNQEILNRLEILENS